MSITRFLLLALFASCCLQLALVKAQESGLSSSGPSSGNDTISSTGDSLPANDTMSSTGAQQPNTTLPSSGADSQNDTDSTGASGASGGEGGDDEQLQQAHDEEEADFADDTCKERTNTPQMSDDGLEVSIDAPSATAGTEDSLGFYLATMDDGGFTIALQYKHESQGSSSDLDFEFKGYSIMEFVGDGAFTEDSVVVQEKSIGAGGWLPFTSEGPDDNGLTTFTAITTDDMFEMVVTIATAGVSVDGKFFNPNQANFDLIIRNWPYMQNDTRLCMEGKLKTSFDIGSEDAEEEEGDDNNGQHGTVTIGDDDLLEMGIQGILNWRQMAMVDDNLVDVLSSTVTEVVAGDDDHEADGTNGPHAGPDDDKDDDKELGPERQYRIYFTFHHNHGAEIVWDPSVGITYVESGPTAAAASLTTSVFAVVFAIVCALLGQWQS
jgi:hypothetical protein